MTQITQYCGLQYLQQKTFQGCQVNWVECHVGHSTQLPQYNYDIYLSALVVGLFYIFSCPQTAQLDSTEVTLVSGE